MKDLRERFAKIEIQSSAPIVPYRETIIAAPEMSPPKDPNLPRGTVVATTPSKQVTVRIRLRPLPSEVTQFLLKNSASIKQLYAERGGIEEADTAASEVADAAGKAVADAAEGMEKSGLLKLPEFCEGLKKAFNEGGEKEVWAGVVEKIAAFGPRRVGPNLLIDATSQGLFRRLYVAFSTAE